MRRLTRSALPSSDAFRGHVRTARSLKADPGCAQADKERFAKLDAGKTGRAAQTVYRDKEKGTRLEGGAEELQALQEAKKPKHEKPSWGGGIAQVHLFPMSQLLILRILSLH